MHISISDMLLLANPRLSFSQSSAPFSQSSADRASSQSSAHQHAENRSLPQLHFAIFRHLRHFPILETLSHVAYFGLACFSCTLIGCSLLHSFVSCHPHSECGGCQRLRFASVTRPFRVPFRPVSSFRACTFRTPGRVWSRYRYLG